MAQGVIPRFSVQEQIFDSKTNLDENNYYNQRHGTGVDDLTKQLVYMLGDFGKNYPISMMTSDMAGKGTTKEMSEIQYSYPIIGRLDKACVVSEDCTVSTVNNTTTPGQGFGTFKVRFGDNWIKRQFTIRSARGVMARVQADPVSLGSSFEYTCQLITTNQLESVPLSELLSGAAWVAMWANVPESESYGTESTMVAPGKVKNQLGIIRHSASWAGHSAERIMNINIKSPVDGKETNRWMDFFLYQFEKQWLDSCEHAYWYSTNNRLATGEISLKDVMTGKPVPTGSGILEQIYNTGTYGISLTYSFLQNTISAALYGQSDTDDMTITLMTGRGGMRALNDALVSKGQQLLTSFGAGNIADKFVTGTGYNLMLGGFFDGFYHIDGYLVKVKYNPIFDYGKVAMAQTAGGYVHPVTGFPLESYRMVFLDDSTYDGQPNIQFVSLKGKPMQHGIVKGMNEVPKSLKAMGGSVSDSIAPNITSDKDASSYHRMKSAGIQLLRGNKCFDLQCVL